MTQSQIAMDVADLVRAAQRGDQAALDELVADHLPLVYNVIGRALAGHPDVDDLVQETMLRAVRGLPGLREPGRFRSWLVAIAYRQIQLHLRSRRAARVRLVPAPVELAALPDPESDFADRAAAEIVVAGQRRELVEAARWLDAGDRRLLGLWWQEASGELTRGELAEAIDVRPSHAAVRVQRMKAQLEAARGVVRALRARPRCPELTAQLRRWNGAAGPLWRKRLVRHVRGCPACLTRGRGLIAPEELLLGMAALPVPTGLLPGLLQSAVPVKASLLGLFQHKTLAVAAATTAAAGGGLVYAVHHETLPPGGGETVIVAPAPTRSAPPGTVRAPSRSLTASATATASATDRPTVGLGVRRADIYVAPTGSDSGDGSAAHPYATLGKAVSIVKPGQTIALRGGTYRPTEPVTIARSGTAAKPIVLSNYRDERPVIDASGIPADQWAITQRTAYWTVQGLEVTHSRSHAYVCSGCRNTVFRRLAMHDNVRSGLMLRDPGTAANQVLDSDFHDNRDPSSPGVGTGLSVQFGDGAGNLVRGNRAWGNGASGFDLGDFASPVTLEYNWSYDNARDGFALAGGSVSAAHTLRHDVAWANAGHGFTDDGAGSAVQLTNDTAYRNGGTGFAFPNGSPLLRSDAAVGNAAPFALSATASVSRNSSDVAFRSTDPAAAIGARPADGRLPQTAYLVTGNGVGASMSY